MEFVSEFLNGKKDEDGNTLTTGFKGSTRYGYRAAIYAFLDSRYGSVRKEKDSTPEERAEYEKLAAKYMKGKVVPLTDLKRYKDYLIELKRPPHSVSQGVTCVRIWLEHNGHELSSKDLRELKKHMPTQRHGVTREGEVSPEVIQTILNHTGDSRLKAAVLLMLSSGIRVGELCKLSVSDIDLKKRTVYISDLIAKTGVSRITFFTEETKDALTVYLSERDKYIDQARRFTVRLKRKAKEGDQLFPISPNVIRTGMAATLKKAGLHQRDPRTQRGTVHPHSLRKYFSSTLKLAGMPEDLVEYLMGHSNGLTMAYRTYNERQLREQYQKYEFCLHVDYSYTASKELRTQIDGADAKIKELTEKNVALQRQVDSLMANAGKVAMAEGELEAIIAEAVKAQMEKYLADREPGILKEIYMHLPKSRGGKEDV